MSDFIPGIEEFNGFRAIYPPTEGIIYNGCSSCSGSVDTSCGFVEGTRYICRFCIVSAIGGNKGSDLLMWAQEKYRKSCSDA